MKKNLAILALALAVSLPLAAQPHPGGPGGPGPNPEQVLKEFLGLSDAQLQQLHTLQQGRQEASEQLQHQAGDAQKALGDALRATPPNPTAVGNALLALNAVQKQLGEIQKAFQSGFDGILTADQKTKLRGLGALDASLQALGAAHGIGL